MINHSYIIYSSLHVLILCLTRYIHERYPFISVNINHISQCFFSESFVVVVVVVVVVIVVACFVFPLEILAPIFAETGVVLVESFLVGPIPSV